MIRPESVPAIVLAGGRNNPTIVAETGVEFRAMTPVGGRPMLDYVLEALRRVGSISEITVVGANPSSSGIRHVDDQGGFVENIFAGLDSATGESVIIATSDIPFVTPESVDNFVRIALSTNADIVYPIVKVDACYDRYPGVKRTAVRLKEGEFTGGNMVLARRGFMMDQRERIGRSYGLRKSPLKLAMMIGFGTAVKLALSVAVRKPLLAIPELESAISRLLGGSARAVISSFPELATDIDRSSDLEALDLARELARIPPAS